MVSVTTQSIYRTRPVGVQRRSDIIVSTAVSGSCVTDLADDLERAVLRHGPDAVLLMFRLDGALAGRAGLENSCHGCDIFLRHRIRVETGAQAVLQTPNG